MLALRSFYLTGVYSPEFDERWPWHCHYEKGRYLSANKRVCGSKSAVEFDCAEDARKFYASWNKAGNFKMEIIEYKRRVEIPDPVLADDDPKTILNKIYENEHSFIKSTAMFWFLGEDVSELWSEKTLKKHRRILLNYGIDIAKEPSKQLEPMPATDDNEWHLAPKIRVVK